MNTLRTVVPILKSGDEEVPCNYRPIFPLPIVSKLLERLLQLHNSVNVWNVSNYPATPNTVTGLHVVSTDTALLTLFSKLRK